MSKAVKNDKGKPDLSLIPTVAAVRMAEAFQVGAARYGRYNYTAGMEASRVVAALQRHAYSWFGGEEFDPDGQHHLGSVMACAAMLLRMQELGTLVDDRYVAVNEATDPMFVLSARGTLDKKPVVLGYFTTRSMAESMLRQYLPEWPGFTLEVDEVSGEHQKAT